MSSSNETALVQSGGGASGAYAVGVMKALFNGESPSTKNKEAGPEAAPERLNPDIFTGTSVGSFNATYMASKVSEKVSCSSALEELEEIWLSDIASTTDKPNGVFRFRGNPARLLDPAELIRHPLGPLSRMTEDTGYLARNLFSRLYHVGLSADPVSRKVLELIDLSAFVTVEPLRQLLKEKIDASVEWKKVLRVSTTCWETGEVAIFGNEAGKPGPGMIHLTERNVRSAILASSSLPGLFPPVSVDGKRYVDGGVVDVTPLQSAIHAGASTLHVIYINPRADDIDEAHVPHTSDTLYRLYVQMVAVNTNRNLNDIRRINRLLYLNGIVKRAVDSEPDSDSLRKLAKLFSDLFLGELRPLTVHNYRPEKGLKGLVGFLDFDSARIEDLIEMGRADARGHDCQANQCIIDPSVESTNVPIYGE